MTPEEEIEIIVAKIFYSYPSDNTEEESIQIGVNEIKKLLAAKDAQISDLENRLKEISAIAVDLGGGK